MGLGQNFHFYCRIQPSCDLIWQIPCFVCSKLSIEPCEMDDRIRQNSCLFSASLHIYSVLYLFYTALWLPHYHLCMCLYNLAFGFWREYLGYPLKRNIIQYTHVFKCEVTTWPVFLYFIFTSLDFTLTIPSKKGLFLYFLGSFIVIRP